MPSNGDAGSRWKTVIGVSLAVVLGGVALTLLARTCQPARQSPVTKAFYSDDDGQTTFVDDLARVAPFDHDGKPAYLARVYKCKNGTTFVAWLERYSERGRQLLNEAEQRRSSGAAVDEQIAAITAGETEVKKPRDPQAPWVLRSTPAGVDVTTVSTGPDGSEVVAAVTP